MGSGGAPCFVTQPSAKVRYSPLASEDVSQVTARDMTFSSCAKSTGAALGATSAKDGSATASQTLSLTTQPAQSSTQLAASQVAVSHGKALLLLTIAAVALGEANCFRSDVLDLGAVALLALSIAACFLGFNALRENASSNASTSSQKSRNTGLARLLQIVPSLTRLSVLNPWLLMLWLVLVLWQIVNAGVALDSMLTQLKLPSWPPLVFGLLAVAGIVWSLRSPLGWWLQLLTFVGIGGWLIAHRLPKIDVFIFQHDACAALLRGQNPYTITFPNMYPDNSPYYGAGLSVGGRLHFGYVYMPLTLLLALPGFLLGDLRYSHMAAVAISALLVAGTRPRAEKALLGALFLWTPMVFFVLFLSWSDSFCVLTICLVFFCARRCPAWLPVACGLFLVSKQYALLAMPLLWLLAPLAASSLPQKLAQSGTSSTRWRGQNHPALFWPFLGKTLAVAALVTLPLALWDFKAFFYSTMLLQFKQPFFPNSLSFMAVSNHLGWGRWPWWLPFGLTLLTLMWTLRRAPRNEVGFLASVALVFLVFFAFNKQAFVNYYYFVLAALWCANMALFERSLRACRESAENA